MIAAKPLAIACLTLLLLVTGGNEALAWGDLGHKIICEIALRQVSPATRAQVDALIRSDSEYTSFADACTWPDHPRKRAAEHFVNLPRDSQGLTTDDCEGATTCVVSAIGKDGAVLNSASASQAEKLASLKYLGHWAGDVHQPLHVSFEDDHGGNGIRVTGKCQSNLHAAWDTCLVRLAVGDDVDVAASRLLASITSNQVQSWAQGSPKDWANETFAITVRPTTRYCVQRGKFCESLSGAVVIDDRYVDANVPVVREQLTKAGIRLAHLLDRAFQH